MKKIEKYSIIQKEEYKNYSLLSPLNEIHQIPKQLYFYGNEKLLHKLSYMRDSGAKILCVIGSRKMTSYGKEAVNFLLSGLAGENIIIVSGLALGVDSEAHRCAIKYNLPTVAFPGSGLNDEALYPQTNIKLLDDIINKGGAAFSEYEPDAKSQMYFFPARNRLMAAISDLVLVIEAEEKSGTQITARLALEYNKDVAIVPGSIFSAYSRGTAQLFKDGAYPVTRSEDILELLKLKSSDFNNKNQNSLFENEEYSKSSKKNLDNIENKDSEFNSALFDSLSDQEKTILNILKAPTHKDDLFDNDELENKNLTPTQILIALTNLEAKGIIKDNFGEIIRVK